MIEELTANQKFMQLVPKEFKIKWIVTNFFSVRNVKDTEYQYEFQLLMYQD